MTLVKIDDYVSILTTDMDYSDTEGYAVVDTLPKEPQEMWDIVDKKLIISEEKMKAFFVKQKELKKNEIERKKAELEFADFTHQNITIQADEKSQSNLTSAIVALLASNQNELSWITSDNKIVSIPKEQVLEIGMALKQRNTLIVFKARQLKDELEKAGTLEQINNIKWEE